MANEINEISIRFADEFEKSLYKLSKRYRGIRGDVKPIINQIQSGKLTGD